MQAANMMMPGITVTSHTVDEPRYQNNASGNSSALNLSHLALCTDDQYGQITRTLNYAFFVIDI